MEKIAILPDTLYRFQLNHTLTSQIFETVQTEQWKNNVRNWGTFDTKLHLKPEYFSLVETLNQHLAEVKDDLNLDCDRLSLSLMWGNKTHPGEWHHGHWHFNSWASGILFLTPTDSTTWFSKPSYWPKTSVLEVLPDTIDRHIVHKYSPQTGDIVVFPSTLYHSVDVHSLPFNRYTISFNCFPEGTIGNFENADQLSISHQ